MGYLEAFIYGAVQGLTEYLPISSSAHLILLPHFLGTPDPGLTFDVFLHFGTLFSTLVYFRKDWWNLFHPGRVQKREISLQHLVIGTIPALIAGFLLNDLAETVFRDVAVLVWTLSLGGVALYLFDYFGKKSKTLKKFTLRDALWVGILQCFALIPGVSRSGSTMIGGLIRGLNRESAARFSFLLSAPVTGAAVVYKMKDLDLLLQSDVSSLSLVIAMVSSFLFGCIAIGGMLRMLRKLSYLSFGLYRIALAMIV